MDDITVSYDLFPTILDVAGINNENKIDGISLIPRLLEKSKIDREMFIGIFLITMVVYGSPVQLYDQVTGN